MSGELAHTAFQPAMGMQHRDGIAERMGASTGKTVWFGHQMGLLLVMVLSEHGCETQKGSTGFLAPKVVLTAWLLGEEVWEPWGLGNNYGDQESFCLPSPFLLSLLSGKKLTEKNSFKIVQE